MSSARLDQALVERGLCESRTKAKRRIEAGDVRVNRQVVLKVAHVVGAHDQIELSGGGDFVGRGALKLLAALDSFGIQPGRYVCVDLGASTGGFTEVLLLRGAQRVFAIDVGHGQLHESLVADPRVVCLEGVNARELTASWWAERGAPRVDFVVADLSFISLTQVIPAAQAVLRSPQWVCLVKPQFEVGRTRIREGIAGDPADHERVLTAVVEVAGSAGLYPAGVMASPVTGEAGNREYLCWFTSRESLNPTQWGLAIHDATHP